MPRLFKSLLRAPIYALILLSGISASASALSTSSLSGRIIHDPKVVNGIANDLLNGLNEARMEEIFLISGAGRLSIKVAPFQPVNSKNDSFPLTLSGELNTFLLAALIQKSQGKFRFHISKPRTDRQTASGNRDQYCDDFTSASRCYDLGLQEPRKYRRSSADIVIIGKLTVENHVGYLSYKAYAPETGVILSATTPRKIHIRRYKSLKATTDARKSGSVAWREYLEPSRGSIFQLQKDLEILGFRPGRINGYLTRQTRHAIQRYQWHHDLDPNGDVSARLLKHIRKQVILSPYPSEISG